jgi:drug/metabolite transporter (DMT)-like permease
VFICSPDQAFRQKVLEVSSSNPKLGILMMIGAVALLTIMSTLVKVIGPDYHPVQISFLRNVIAAAIILPILLRAGGMQVLKTRRPGLITVRSVAGISGNILYFYAFQRMAVGDVIVIAQAVPLFVTAMAVLFMGERVGWRRWAAVSLGFVGVIIAINPSSTVSSASLIAVAATGLWASTILMMRSLGATESPYSISFYFMAIGAVLTAFAQPWVWQTPTYEVWLLLVCVGAAGAFGQILMSYALKLADASVVSPFNYTGILWAIGFDLVIWDVMPASATVAGAALITAAGVYIFRREAIVRRR